MFNKIEILNTRKCKKVINLVKRKNKKWNFDEMYVIGNDKGNFSIELVDTLNHKVIINLDDDKHEIEIILKSRHDSLSLPVSINWLISNINQIPKLMDSTNKIKVITHALIN